MKLRDDEPEVYCTSFCNKGHRMRDGMPIDHECYVIPPTLLRLERDEAPERDDAWFKWSQGPRRISNGITGR